MIYGELGVKEFVVMMLVRRIGNAMDGQIDAGDQEEHGTYMAKPFLERTEFGGKLSDGDGTIAYEPRNEHDRQSCRQAEYDGHRPSP